METLRLNAVVGEDRKITITLPSSVPTGPVEVVVVINAPVPEKKKLTWSDMHGMGKEIWEGIDAQEYVNKIRSGEEL